MITVELSTGFAVTLKGFLSRKLRKQINAILYAEVTADSTGKTTGFTMQKIDEANDVEVLGMVESIKKDGVDVPVNADFFDNLPDEDFKQLLTEVKKITEKESPKG